jgi:uncharacterized protein
VLFVASSALAQPKPPQLTGPVNDFARVIDGDSTRQMESLIRSLQEATGDVVVVATIDSLDDEDIDQYAVKMFENNGKGYRSGWEGQRPARARGDQGSQGQDRGRL